MSDSSWLLHGESASASVLGVNSGDNFSGESALALVGDSSSWYLESEPDGES